MKKIQGVVVAALLAIWCFPAVSSAKTLPADPAPLPAVVTSTRAPVAAEAPATTQNAESANLAQREQQSQNLQDYKGGAAVVYVGSGVLLVVVIVLLILLL